jgi:hypothetical protein
MPVIAVTRLHIRSLRFVPGFLVYTVRSSMQVRRARGYVGGWGSNEWPLGFWTATCWNDSASMRAFRNGEPHLTAMRKLLHWCDEASFVHWEQDDQTVPDPAEAYRRLAEGGTLSKVANPSERQQAGRTVGSEPPRRAGPIPPAEHT